MKRNMGFGKRCILASLQRHIAPDLLYAVVVLKPIRTSVLDRIIRPAYLFALAEHPLFTSALKSFLAHIRKPLFRISPKSVPENSISPFWGSQIHIWGKAKILMSTEFSLFPKMRFGNPSMSRCKVVHRVLCENFYHVLSGAFMLSASGRPRSKGQENVHFPVFFSPMSTKKDLEESLLQGLLGSLIIPSGA